MAAELKKKIRPGAIELDPKEPAIVVKCEVQEVLLMPDGSQKIQSSKPGNKKIPVKNLTASTNIPLMAAQLVKESKVIHESKTGLVEELLKQLLARLSGVPMAKTNGNGASPRMMSNGVSTPELAEVKRGGEVTSTAIFKAQQRQYAPAHIQELEDYIEDLYDDDMGQKVKATGMIAQLFRETANFQPLLGHDTLLQTLSRILREEGKKSIDLCINIISVFFSISNFSQFHNLVLENQVGAMTMDIVDLEVKRTELRIKEEGISPAMVAQKAMEASNHSAKLTDREKKMLGLIQKQDRLLYICFYLLLNLAEDVGIERKMKKKNIVVYLVKMLDRSNVELLILATTFLKKLSIYRENKDLMAECNIVNRLIKFVPVRNEVLLMAVLRLLHNLSFDAVLRDQMVQAGIIPKCVDMMTTPRFQPVVMGLLYHISMEDKFKSMFTYTDAINKIFEMLMRVQELRNTPELIALSVNLTQNTRNAEQLTEGDRFDRLVKRAIQTSDELLLKVVRNLSQADNGGLKRRFLPYIEQLVVLLKSRDITAELFVEVLGTLSNLHIPDYDYMAMVKRHDLLNFLSSYAQPGAVDDDILLEVVMFLGVITNEETSTLIVNSGMVGIMFHLMGEKKEDDEFVLQIAYTFHKFLLHDETRKQLLHKTQVVYYLVDLLQDKNKEVRRVADSCLDIVMDSDEDWAVKIRSLKFESFNQEWLESSAQNGKGPRGGVRFAQEEVDHNDSPRQGGNYIGQQRTALELDELERTQRINWNEGDLNGYGDAPSTASYDEEEFVKSYAM